MKKLYALFILAICGVLVPAIYLLDLAKDPREAVRVRNALNFEAAALSQFSWAPSNVPAGFRWISSHQSEVFHNASRRFASQSNGEMSELVYVKNVAEHLNATKLNSQAIQQGVEETYSQIVKGSGYCADYTVVFTAFAQAQDIGVREWGMSFDGFSGNGHAFNEIYSEQLNQWVFVDSFYGFLVRDSSTGRPMSFLEFRTVLMDGAPQGRIIIDEITPKGPPFKSHQALLDYYQKGMELTFLIMANDGVVADTATLSRLLQWMPVSLRQLLGIGLGVYPQILILQDGHNEVAIQQLQNLRMNVLASMLVLVLAGLVIAVLLGFWIFSAYRGRSARKT